MKKLFLILFALISINCIGQDTLIYQKRNQFYMIVRQPIANDNPLIKSSLYEKQRIRKKQNRVFVIVTGVIFTSLTYWYFSNTLKYN
jgi:hypothetical protein